MVKVNLFSKTFPIYQWLNTTSIANDVEKHLTVLDVLEVALFGLQVCLLNTSTYYLLKSFPLKLILICLNKILNFVVGLSASGKSTISMGVEDELVSRGIACYCLDGDNLRAGLCKGLGFSLEDRKENIRRAIEAAKLQADGGTIVLCSLVSPMEEDRQNARQIATNANLPFFEVHVNTSIEDCIKRDPKKLYKKALAGEIKNFTGVGQSYEVPENPELSLSTVDPILGTPRAVEACVGEVIKLLKDEVSFHFFFNLRSKNI